MREILEIYREVSAVKDLCNELANKISKLRKVACNIDLLTDDEKDMLQMALVGVEIIGTKANTKQLKMKKGDK